MANKKVCLWDLEGPISALDFAAELGGLLRDKPKLGIECFNMTEFFTMVSNYDDYLIDIPGVKERLGILEYQPGDTLRLMAPLYLFSFSDRELKSIAKSNLGLIPGAYECMQKIKETWEIFVISTSYTQFAYSVTEAIGIPKDHVYCTNLNFKDLAIDYSKIKEALDVLIYTIFQKYIDNSKNLEIVIEDLNKFFWLGRKSEYHRVMNEVSVRGGKRKELAAENISKRTGVSLSNVISVGDSITDINMLERVNREGGFAISFNGNRFSLKRANISVTTKNQMGILPIFENHPHIFSYLKKWEENYDLFKDNPEKIPNTLINRELKDYFIKYKFVPELHILKNKDEIQLDEIIDGQVKMRKFMRGWAGDLG